MHTLHHMMPRRCGGDGNGREIVCGSGRVWLQKEEVNKAIVIVAEVGAMVVSWKVRTGDATKAPMANGYCHDMKRLQD